MSISQSELNAVMEVRDAKSKGNIKYLRKWLIGPITGIWVKEFPSNTSKEMFLKFFCVNNKDLYMKIRLREYDMLESKGGEGYDVVFR
jgi:hypothetical protein